MEKVSFHKKVFPIIKNVEEILEKGFSQFSFSIVDPQGRTKVEITEGAVPLHEIEKASVLARDAVFREEHNFSVRSGDLSAHLMDIPFGSTLIYEGAGEDKKLLGAISIGNVELEDSKKITEQAVIEAGFEIKFN